MLEFGRSKKTKMSKHPISLAGNFIFQPSIFTGYVSFQMGAPVHVGDSPTVAKVQ